jgi:hypothetical protein
LVVGAFGKEKGGIKLNGGAGPNTTVCVRIVWFSRHKQAWIGERLVSAKSANIGVNIGLVDGTTAIETRRDLVGLAGADAIIGPNEDLEYSAGKSLYVF